MANFENITSLSGQLDKIQLDNVIDIKENATLTISQNTIISNTIANSVSLDVVKDIILVINGNDKENIHYQINVKNGAKLSLFTLYLNKNISNNIEINLIDTNSEIDFRNLVLGNNVDVSLKILVNHLAPYTTSFLQNYGVANNKSVLEFLVDGAIENKMTGANCRQNSRGLILDDYSKITIKPILEIDYYDVSAYHGSSIGKINEDDLFYLMSRGLSKEDAYKIVLYGIVREFYPYIQNYDSIDEVLNCLF